MEKTIITEIESIAFGGRGVTRIDGKVCFVPGTIPTEKVKIAIIKEKKNFLVARLLEILRSSQFRIAPVCPFAVQAKNLRIINPVCPGCCFQHLDYQYEVKIKQEQLISFLAKIPDFKTEAICPPVPSPEHMNYRNKITLHAQKDGHETMLGYIHEDNQTVFDIPACPLAKQEINELLTKLKNQTGFTHTLHDKMTLTLRYTETDGAIFWRNKPDKKLSWLKENTSLGPVSIPAGSFFQVNPSCSDLLLKAVSSTVAQLKPELVIDAFCGTGIFSFAVAKFAKKVYGFDADQEAIKTADFNAENLNHINCEFQTLNAANIHSRILKKANPAKTLLIMDPPRTGLHKKFIDIVSKSGIKQLLYISCAPDTLTRDLQILRHSGYLLRSSQLFDMFPRTSHFETINLLENSDQLNTK